MVQSVSAPAKTTQTLEGLIMAKVCTGEECVISQVECRLRLYDDGTWYVAYWQPLDPANNAQAFGDRQCEADVVASMLDAIASLAPAAPDVP